MKVFVTGGAGFLGINLVRHLLAHGAEEVASYDIAEFDYPEKDDPRHAEANAKLVDVENRMKKARSGK